MTTKTATYTPGPWTPVYDGNDVRVEHFEPMGMIWPIARISRWDGMPDGMAETHAALIAAAPDLLKALDSLLGSFGWMFDAMETTHCKCDISDTECRDWDGGGTDHEEIRDAHALLKVIRKTIAQARGETCA
jgi:hypothetical protein